MSVLALIHILVLLTGLLLFAFSRGESKTVGLWMFIAALLGVMIATGPAVARLLHG